MWLWAAAEATSLAWNIKWWPIKRYWRHLLLLTESIFSLKIAVFFPFKKPPHVVSSSSLCLNPPKIWVCKNDPFFPPASLPPSPFPPLFPGRYVCQSGHRQSGLYVVVGGEMDMGERERERPQSSSTPPPPTNWVKQVLQKIQVFGWKRREGG